MRARRVAHQANSVRGSYLLACSLVRALTRSADSDKAVAAFSAALLVALLEFGAGVATAIWVEVLGGPPILSFTTKPVTVGCYLLTLAATWFGVFRGERLDLFDARCGQRGSVERSRNTALGAGVLLGCVAYIVLAYVALAHRVAH